MFYWGSREGDKYYLDKKKKERNVKTDCLIFDTLQWSHSLCVSIILLIASVSQAIATPCKAVEDPMGREHKDGVERIVGKSNYIHPILFTENTVALDHFLKTWFCLLFNYEG